MERYEGLHEFVLTRGPALSRTAYLLTGDHQLAEDLLQQALAKTATHWRRVLSGGNPEGYVRRVMVNERTSWWRRRRYVEVAGPAADEVLAAGPARGTGDEAEAAVRRISLRRALAALPARQRAVIVLRFFEDLTEAQAADAMGTSVGTVKSQTHAALQRLRELAPDLLADFRAEVTP
ncbi:SigE family RNA polymerase sigma factor [Phytohabitans aurantiacus]|jgi:RNA polymerase sigma-70 factor (sigma-E family)|uniref:RNA polymerase sigma factor n=1 Tax=Phytohabitans aurantiacus TaxID=3016789 RepID=A0ABQ5R5M6_9ACTN|nr:SigE family RNA polymerase sigma factor [Phytohabitans aurantiacus]GLI01868.1 RNA polymerase sigma factor [Phytohabitans aurantiacus]